MADEVLLQGVSGITNLITTPGLINTDFADVKMVLSQAGSALMGIGQASGDERAVSAAKAAISSPLLEAAIDGARGVLLNITGPSSMGLFEMNAAAEIIHGVAHADANIIFGTVIDDEMGDEVKVTVIAAGFDRLDGAGRRPTGQVADVDLRAVRRGRGRPARRRRRRRLRRPVVPALTARRPRRRRRPTSAAARARIAAAGGGAGVELLAVTKGFGADAVVAAAAAAGCAAIGENYAQELVAKADAVAGGRRRRALHRPAAVEQGAPARRRRSTCGRRVDRPRLVRRDRPAGAGRDGARPGRRDRRGRQGRLPAGRRGRRSSSAAAAAGLRRRRADDGRADRAAARRRPGPAFRPVRRARRRARPARRARWG